MTSNPVAVAEFFHCICEAFFTNLLRSDSGHLGVLGDVSAHYGVVESNGRGMLHLHCLVWLGGNFTFDNLRTRVLNDAEFAQDLITFIESIITTSVDSAIDTDNFSFNNMTSFSSAQ